MGISPDYGDTPLSGDKFDALLPSVAELFGEAPGKTSVYDFGQAVQVSVAQR